MSGDVRSIAEPLGSGLKPWDWADVRVSAPEGGGEERRRSFFRAISNRLAGRSRRSLEDWLLKIGSVGIWYPDGAELPRSRFGWTRSERLAGDTIDSKRALFESVSPDLDFRGIESEVWSWWEKEATLDELLNLSGKRFRVLRPEVRNQGIGPEDEKRAWFVRNLRFGAEANPRLEPRVGAWWPVYRFFVEMANRNSPYLRSRPFHHLYLTNLDRFLLARLQVFVSRAHEVLKIASPGSPERFDGLGEEIEGFGRLVESEVLPRFRARLERGEGRRDERTIFASLFEVLYGVVVTVAPLTPFLSEFIYRNLVRGLGEEEPASVHFCLRPRGQALLEDPGLLEEFPLVLDRLRLASEERVRKGLPHHQPLASVTLRSEDDGERWAFLSNERMFCEELRVKRVRLDRGVAGSARVEFATDLTDDLRAEGIVLELAHYVRRLRERTLGKVRCALLLELDDRLRPAVDRYSSLLRTESGCSPVRAGDPRLASIVDETEIRGGRIVVGLFPREP